MLYGLYIVWDIFKARTLWIDETNREFGFRIMGEGRDDVNFIVGFLIDIHFI